MIKSECVGNAGFWNVSLPPFPLCIRKWQPATAPSGEGEFICAAHQKLFVCVFEGARKDGDTKTANPICSMRLKKKREEKTSIKLSALSVRSLCLWRAKTRFAITAACIYSDLWLSLTGQIICWRWFCFSTNKEKQTNKQKPWFCCGPSGLNATLRGEAGEERQQMTTFGSNFSPGRPSPVIRSKHWAQPFFFFL